VAPKRALPLGNLERTQYRNFARIPEKLHAFLVLIKMYTKFIVLIPKSFLNAHFEHHRHKTREEYIRNWTLAFLGMYFIGCNIWLLAKVTYEELHMERQRKLELMKEKAAYLRALGKNPALHLEEIMEFADLGGRYAQGLAWHGSRTGWRRSKYLLISPTL
jgi:hypothetical protein